MDWVPILVGAGAGVVAVLISRGILRLLGKREAKGARILHTIVFVVALALAREFVEPRIQAQRVEAALLEVPAYQALQRHEPEAYEKMRTLMEEGIARKMPKEEIWSATRGVVSQVVAKRLPHASDDALLHFSQHFVTTVTRLHDQGGTACFSYLNPAPGEALDFDALLGKEFAQQELHLVAEVVSSAAGSERTPVPEAEVQRDIETVIQKLFAKYGEEGMAALRNPNSPQVDKRRVCEVLADLHREATALPSPRNARLVRYLLQG